MMRSIWISLALLSLIIAFATVSTCAMNKSISQMEAHLSELKECPTKDRERILQEVEAIFQKRYTLFSVSLLTEDVDEVKNAMELLKSACKENDDDAYKDALCAFSFAICRIRNASMPSFETIF